MKMEPIEGPETSAFRTQTPGIYPKENILHKEHGESVKTRKLQYTLKKFFSIIVGTRTPASEFRNGAVGNTEDRGMGCTIMNSPRLCSFEFVFLLSRNVTLSLIVTDSWRHKETTP